VIDSENASGFLSEAGERSSFMALRGLSCGFELRLPVPESDRKSKPALPEWTMAVTRAGDFVTMEFVTPCWGGRWKLGRIGPRRR